MLVPVMSRPIGLVVPRAQNELYFWQKVRALYYVNALRFSSFYRAACNADAV